MNFPYKKLNKSGFIIGEAYEQIKDKLDFDENVALKELLENEVIFLNSFWYYKHWPEEAKK